MVAKSMRLDRARVGMPSLPSATTGICRSFNRDEDARIVKPQPDQDAPLPLGPAGAKKLDRDYQAQSGDRFTTAGGVRLPDHEDSLKAGDRGPTLIEDFHFREKITHFDHERIPERVVHAGVRPPMACSDPTVPQPNSRGPTSCKKGPRQPVFTRFSTVVGSRGSADTARDVRGFAVKFYTSRRQLRPGRQQHPGLLHPGCDQVPGPDPRGEAAPRSGDPAGTSAHDTFWDFASLHTEATHMLMWVMSDRAIPRSYRTMEGFGVHTFRLVNNNDGSRAGQVPLEAPGLEFIRWSGRRRRSPRAPILTSTAGIWPMRSRRGPSRNGTSRVQVFEDNATRRSKGSTSSTRPRSCRRSWRRFKTSALSLSMPNPTNYFAETEQVHLTPATLFPASRSPTIRFSKDGMFSYLDTQLSRLGGPNFTQLPVNRPRVPVNDMLRDGMHQTAVHRGVAPYKPNSLDGGVPKVSTRRRRLVPTCTSPRATSSARRSERPTTVFFSDHYSQARLFWLSMTEVERVHIVEAFTFELGKCYEEFVRERMLEQPRSRRRRAV